MDRMGLKLLARACIEYHVWGSATGGHCVCVPVPSDAMAGSYLTSAKSLAYYLAAEPLRLQGPLHLHQEPYLLLLAFIQGHLTSERSLDYYLASLRTSRLTKARALLHACLRAYLIYPGCAA
jgi:hypothetical protein